MARGSATVTVKVTGDVSRFRKGLDKAESRLGKFSSRLRSGAATMAKWGARAAAAGAAAAGAFGVKAVKSAIDLQETISKSDTIFKENVKVVEKWAEGAADSIGQSKQQALEAAASFGNMFDQLGFAEDATADMSTSMVELASDFASFHNADVTQVLEAQAAAFRGEYDAVQRFVPTINAAAVQEQALAMGLAETTDELDAQDKALATQKLLMEGAGEAAGDFERTSGGLANRLRIMKARSENFAASVGMRLIPFVERALDLFESWAGPVGDAAEAAFYNVSRALTPLVDGFRQATAGEYGLIKAFQVGQEQAGATYEDMNTLERALSILGGAFESVRSVVTSSLEGVRSVVGSVVATVRGWIGRNQKTLEDWGARGEEILGQFRETFQSAFEAVRTVMTVTVNLLRDLWERFGRHLVDFAGRQIGRLLRAVSGGLDILRGIFEVITGILTGDWSKAWDGIKRITSGAVKVVTNLLSGMVDAVKTILGGAVAGVSAVWGRLWGGLKDAFRNVLNWIIGKWNAFELTIGGATIDPPGPGPKIRVPSVTLGTPDLPRLARGGFASGLAVVGERGPELVNLGRGSRVFSNEDSRQMVRPKTNITVNTHTDASARDIADQITWSLRTGGAVA